MIDLGFDKPVKVKLCSPRGWIWVSEDGRGFAWNAMLGFRTVDAGMVATENEAFERAEAALRIVVGAR